MKTTHEDADVIIPQQVALADMGCSIINVIMEPTSRSRSSIDIGATAAEHSGIVPPLIAAHAVAGCDTVGCYRGIEKTTGVKALSAGIELNYLGDPKASLVDAMKDSRHFISARYGQKSDQSDTMSSVRYKLWVSRTGRKGASILPKLKSLPPATESFRENVKRARCQACIWKAVLQ